jgi:hypothetical protein
VPTEARAVSIMYMFPPIQNVTCYCFMVLKNQNYRTVEVYISNTGTGFETSTRHWQDACAYVTIHRVCVILPGWYFVSGSTGVRAGYIVAMV